MVSELNAIKYSLAFIVSLPLVSLYLLSMFFPITFSFVFISNPKSVAMTSFYFALALLIIRELISDSRWRDLLTVLIIFVFGVYSYVAGLYYELNSLVYVDHFVIPPSFIYIPCSDTARCNGFSALSISVPLTISFALFVYGLAGLLRTVRTGVAK